MKDTISSIQEFRSPLVPLFERGKSAPVLPFGKGRQRGFRGNGCINLPGGAQHSSGVTLVELMVTMVILSILATCILPLSQVSRKRSKEVELRQTLRTIRSALDEHKRYVEDGRIAKQATENGYPQDLQILVKGVDLAGPVAVRKKFLRRIPKDPMTEDGEWGLRSYSDEPDSKIWGGQDVYDIYSKSDEVALDGTPYNEW